MKLTRKQERILRKIARATIKLIGGIGLLGFFVAVPILAGETTISLAAQFIAILGTILVSCGCIKVYSWFMS